MSDRTPKEMRDDALAWSRAGYPNVAIGRYRDAADQIDRLEKKCAALAKLAYPVHPDPTGKTREPPHCPSCNCPSPGHPTSDGQ